MREITVHKLKFIDTWDRRDHERQTLILFRTDDQVMLGMTGLYGGDDRLLTMAYAEAAQLSSALTDLLSTGGRRADSADQRAPRLTWDTCPAPSGGMRISLHFSRQGSDTGVVLSVKNKSDNTPVIYATFWEHDAFLLAHVLCPA